MVPFGTGLSYTTFKYSPKPSAATVSLEPVRDMLADTARTGHTFPSSAVLEAVSAHST
eukprot:COSAG01_NODE_47964_length_385_cov_1.076923_1_plen_58_part_00